MTYDVIYTDNNTNPYFSATFLITNYNVSQWTTDGKTGLWISIGYGNDVMTNTDITLCQFTYTNSISDAFTCEDGYIGNLKSLWGISLANDPSIYSAQTVDKRIADDTGNFSVKFERPLNIANISKD